MNTFDNNVEPRTKGKSPQSANNCDIFEPSVYTPEESKYRAEYIKRITAKITAELDASLLAEELPDDKDPSLDLEVTGKDPEKHFKFIAKYLRGPRGFNGSADNIVVLSEAEYDRLRVKDPNKFYFTYDDSSIPAIIENNILIAECDIDNNILSITGEITNNILIV